jgi:hypothetical protein
VGGEGRKNIIFVEGSQVTSARSSGTGSKKMKLYEEEDVWNGDISGLK